MTLVRSFNKLGNIRKTLIQKALTSATNVGEALIPQHLEDVVTNAIVRLAPEIAIIEPEFDPQKFHEFNRLTALPSAGGAMGEGATTPSRNATYSRNSVELKIVRRKGAVTGFLQDTAAGFTDAQGAEMENHLTAHVYDLIVYLLYGNKAADAYTWDGLDFFIATTRVNQALGGAVPADLTFLDDLIDENIERQGIAHRKAFAMSAKMQSKISRLLTNVRLNQGQTGDGMTQVEVRGGWRLAAYRDVPIIPSSALRPKQTMTTITVAAAGSGTLTDGTYYVRVAPITYNGEELASAEASDTASSSETLTVSFSAFSGALFYKLYIGTSSGALFLRRIFSAFTYDGTGTITGSVTSYVFTDTNPMTADSSVPTHMQLDRPLVATAGVPPELLLLWDLDKYQGLGKVPFTNSGGTRFRGLVTLEPLAITDDNLPFLIKTYAALVDSFEATSGMNRGLRVS